MGDSKIGIALVLSATNKASAVINKMVNGAIRDLDKLQTKSATIAYKSFNTGQQLVASGLAVGAPIYGAIDAATQFETKMVDIRKQINALDDPKQLAAMQKQILTLGKQLPIPISEIQDLIAAGARMDIPKEQLIDYTKEVTKMSVAFDISAGEMGESMGKIAKVFNVPIQQIGKMADAINYLDDNAISKGGEIIDVMQRIGGTAKYLKSEQAAALASTFLTLGETPERASSGINELIVTLSAAEAQSKKARAAFAYIGLNPSSVQKRFVTDAQGTILDVLQRINKVKPSQQNTVLAMLFGQEHIGKIAKLANSYKEYERQLDLVKGKQAGSMDREYQKRIASTAAQLQIAKNNMQTTAILIGTTVLPAFNRLLQRFAGITTSINNFSQRHPRFIKLLVYTAAAFSALALTGGYMAFVVGGIAKGFNIVTGAAGWVLKGFKALQFAIFALRFHFVTGLLPAITKAMTAFRVFGLALLTNPLTLYIAAAVALAGIVYLIIRNWDSVKKFFVKCWEGIKIGFRYGIEAVKKMLILFNPALLIYSQWGNITKFFGGLFGKVRDIFGGLVKWVYNLAPNFFNAGINIVKSIWNGIKSMAHKPVQAIRDMVKKMRDYLPFSPAKVGPLRDIHRVKLVETIAGSLKPDALLRAWHKTINVFAQQIRKPSAVPAFAGGGGGSVTFHYNPVIQLHGSATQQDAGKLASMGMQEFERMMKQYEANKQRRSF